MLQNNPHITQLQITTKSEDIGLLLCTQYWDWRSFITQLPINQSCSLHTAYSICVRLLTGRCLVCFTDRQTAVSLAEHLSGSAVHSSEQYTAVDSTQQSTVDALSGLTQSHNISTSVLWSIFSYQLLRHTTVRLNATIFRVGAQILQESSARITQKRKIIYS